MYEDYNDKLIITIAMPRSGTKWLTEVMKPFCTETWHDPLANCASIAELGEKVDARIAQGLGPKIGNCNTKPIFIADTGALFFQGEILERFPGARFLFVQRGLPWVMASLDKAFGEKVLSGRAANYMHSQFLGGDAIFNPQRSFRITFIQLFGADDNARHGMWNVLFSVKSAYSRPESPYPKAHFDDYLAKNIQVPVEEQKRNTDPVKTAILFKDHMRYLQ